MNGYAESAWNVIVNCRAHPWNSYHQCTKDEVEIVGELADVRAQNCLNMTLPRTNRSTGHRMDSQCIGSSCHQNGTERVTKGWRDTQVISNALRVMDNFVLLETKPATAS